MGGGGSKINYGSVTLPYPVRDNSKGLTVSTSQGCTDCRFILYPNISSSSVTLEREDVPPGNEAEIDEFRKKNYSVDTKLNIKPTIPFKVNLNGEEYSIDVMTLYKPSPLRIDNIQHDAVISLGHPTLSKLFILIPIVADSSPGDSGEFLSRVASRVSSITTPGTDNKFPKIEVPTGSDWNLTKLIPLNPDTGEVRGGFFTWAGTGPLTQVTQFKGNQFVTSWVPTGEEGPQYIMMRDPAKITAGDLANIQTLPTTKPEYAIHGIVENTVVYRPGPPADCPTRPGLPEGQCDPFASMKPKSTVNANLIFTILSTLGGFILSVIVVYFAIKYAAKQGVGDSLYNFGQWLGKKIGGKAKKEQPLTSIVPPGEARGFPNPLLSYGSPGRKERRTTSRTKTPTAEVPRLEQTVQDITPAAAPVIADNLIPNPAAGTGLTISTPPEPTVKRRTIAVSPIETAQNLIPNPAAGTGLLPLVPTLPPHKRGQNLSTIRSRAAAADARRTTARNSRIAPPDVPAVARDIVTAPSTFVPKIPFEQRVKSAKEIAEKRKQSLGIGTGTSNWTDRITQASSDTDADIIAARRESAREARRTELEKGFVNESSAALQQAKRDLKNTTKLKLTR